MSQQSKLEFGQLTDRRPIILVVGDAIAPTGYARVTHSIITRLQDQFEFVQLGINYHGDPHGEQWSIYPAGTGGDPHGVNRIQDIVARTKPNLILLVNDISIIGHYLDRLRDSSEISKIVGYFPVESHPLRSRDVLKLQSLDQIVVYNDFGLQTLKATANEVKRETPDFICPPLAVVPHGIDTTIFKPLFPIDGSLEEGRRAVRQALLPDDPSFHDAFIVLNANRNQPRKRIDVTIAGFAQFASDKPSNVKLYLHMGTVDQGWDVRELAQRHGITDRLILSHVDALSPRLETAQLNQVYNACDIGVNTAEAEGWGLVSFEHAATAAAQIVPRHSGPEYLWDGHAELLTPTMHVTTPGLLTHAYLVAPSTVADALEKLYQDLEFRHRRSMDAYNLANNTQFSWDTISSSFSELFKKLLHL